MKKPVTIAVKRGDIVALRQTHSTTTVFGAITTYLSFEFARAVSVDKDGRVLMAATSRDSVVRRWDCCYALPDHQQAAETLLNSGPYNTLDEIRRVLREATTVNNQTKGNTTMKDVKALTTNELLAEYNLLTGKGIKKFASRAAAEKQVLAARGKGDSPAPAPKPVKKQKEESEDRPKYKNRSEAIRESWGSKAVAAARSERSGVQVAGHGDYRSVADAFRQLRLPMGRHIKFRSELKAAGQLTFKDEQRGEFKFKIVEQKAE